MAADTRRLARFSGTLRVVHWVHATAFLILLASGLCLYLPSLSEAVNRRPLLKTIHLYTAVAWIVALALVVVFGNRRELVRAAREIDRFDADDRAWLRGRSAPQGWLNAGQKLNAIVTAAFAVLFTITGFFLWYGERDTNCAQPEVLSGRDHWSRVPLKRIVGNTDEHPRFGLCNWRRTQQHTRREDDHE